MISYVIYIEVKRAPVSKAFPGPRWIAEHVITSVGEATFAIDLEDARILKTRCELDSPAEYRIRIVKQTTTEEII